MAARLCYASRAAPHGGTLTGLEAVTESTDRAEDVRTQLSFDVERLRTAAQRLQGLDRALVRLKTDLEVRAVALSGAATARRVPELGGDGSVALHHAKAQATAALARRAKLGEILARTGRLSLIASMAINHWIRALSAASRGPLPEVVVKGHIDAGRIAHRMLVALRRKDRLRSGCGQLASAVVVAEFAHHDNLTFVHEEILEGLFRGRNARGMVDDQDVVAAASRALRAGADLLEHMARRAEPGIQALMAEADRLDADVEERLRRG